MNPSSSVVLCASCNKRLKLANAKFCAECYEGQIAYLKGAIDLLEDQIRGFTLSCSVTRPTCATPGDGK